MKKQAIHWQRILNILTPFLFAVSAPLVILERFGLDHLAPENLLRPFGFALLATAVLFSLQLIIKDWEKTALVVSLLVVFLFFHRDFLQVLVLILAVIFGVQTFLWWRSKRKQTWIAGAMLYLSSLALVFFGFYTAQVMLQVFGIPWQFVRQVQQIAQQPIEIVQPVSETPPDIYYLVFDEYGRADVLQDYFEFDNREFLQALQARGFYIAEQSTSNYPRTVQSVASTLNMDYFNWRPQDVPPNFAAWWTYERAIRDNRLRRFLVSQGYQIWVIPGGWWNITFDQVDHAPSPFVLQLTEFESAWVRNSGLLWAQKIYPNLFSIGDYRQHQQAILSGFENIAVAASAPSPKFVYTHLVTPHPPFIFDAQGNLIKPPASYIFDLANFFLNDPEQYQQHYNQQIQFINNKILATIDTILENSSRPPIIILQADHGTALLSDVAFLEKTCIRERFSILNAYYLPEGDTSALWESITPVNTFRLVLSRYFGANLPPLPDKNYFANEKDFYRFTDVTALKNDICDATQP